MPTPPSGFQAGAKVVCIDDRFDPAALPHFQSMPRRNEIYTIRSLVRGKHWRTGTPGFHLTLDECPRSADSPLSDPGFLIRRFRTLSDFCALLAYRKSLLRAPCGYQQNRTPLPANL